MRDASQVSRAIAVLEAHLQVKLFQRSTRSLALTEAGRRYLNRITPALEELGIAAEEARQVSKLPKGTLRLTASTAFGQIYLLPKFRQFYEQYPDITLELEFTDRNLDLLSENIDLACRLSPSFESDHVGIKLFDTHYRVCASPAFLDQAAAIFKPEDIVDHNCVVLNLPQYRTEWQFWVDGQCDYKIKVGSRTRVSNALALRECLLMDMGLGLAPDWLVAEQLNSGELVDVFPEYNITATDFNTAVWLLYPSKEYLPSKTRVMIEFLKSAL